MMLWDSALVWELGNLAFVPDFVAGLLCDLEKIISFLCVSFLLSVKWGKEHFSVNSVQLLYFNTDIPETKIRLY